jgi:hypothetical protein
VVTPKHPLAVALVLALILAAAIGYLAGQGDARKPAPERLLTASENGVIVDYPPSWGRARPAAIPGLPLEQPITLGPSSDASLSGLVTGRFPGGEAAPLPSALIALLTKVPAAEVINVLGYQTFRYAHVSVRGLDREVTLFAIPNLSSDPTALACYAPIGQSSVMQACERIAATLTVAEQAQSYNLTPEASYASSLRRAIAGLRKVRGALRAQMSSHASTVALRRDATRLSAAFASARDAVALLQAPQIAARAQSLLAADLRQAQGAYVALAAAASADDTGRLQSARAQVYAAEAAVGSALSGYALLGYPNG